MQDWIINETRGVDFGDERLDSRFRLLLDRLADKPSLSIPAACNGQAEVAAAYRFLDNERVTAERVLHPHVDATRERVRAQRVVLVAQDTTELDLTRRQEKVGGPLNENSRWGMFAHPQLALTPERLPLGLIGAKIWSRDAAAFAKSAEEKRRERKAKPIEEKESFRWLEGYRQACALAEQSPGTRVVSLADSEGDIYECLLEATTREGVRADWIIRGCQDRVLLEENRDLRQALLDTASLGSFTIEVSARHGAAETTRKRKQARVDRQATVSVRSGSVTLRPPQRPGTKLLPVKVNAVLVLEENPPEGEEPIEWLLLTSLPVATFAEAQTVIAYYCCRWEIEIYFRVLKGGCRVEDLQLETAERFEACLAMYMIVAWRVLHLLKLGRDCPEMGCDAVLSEAEWKSVYQIVTKRPAPKQPPPLGEMIRLIAQLGGYTDRKHDGPPGPKTLWIGMQRMRDFALAWLMFNPVGQRAEVV